jgi:hypothetical protein
MCRARCSDHPLAPQKLQALGDISADALAPVRLVLRSPERAPDRRQQQRGHHIAHCVEAENIRRRHHGDQGSAQGGPDEQRDRARRGDEAYRGRQLSAVHEGGQRAEVGRVEPHEGRPDAERDDEQLRQN